MGTMVHYDLELCNKKAAVRVRSFVNLFKSLEPFIFLHFLTVHPQISEDFIMVFR